MTPKQRRESIKTKLLVRLYADDQLVAEIEDARLWGRALEAIRCSDWTTFADNGSGVLIGKESRNEDGSNQTRTT